MSNLKHKSIVFGPGVKRIQNYIFRFSDVLGKGNFSTVYKGFNEKTHETVAIKYISFDSLNCERLEELLNQEIQILTSISHPSIIKCHEVLKSSNNCYIISELCDGGDLETLLNKKRALCETEAIPYIRDIYEGLLYLSKKNVTHRDLKIANIFLAGGKAKIADFGFAQKYDRQFNDGKIGTPLCMSPQGFLENLYGSKTDPWSFGTILYQLTHGKLHLAFCNSEQMLEANIRNQIRFQDLNPNLSAELRHLIVKCLDTNPLTRPTFQEMRTDPFIQRITARFMDSYSLKNLNGPSTYNRVTPKNSESYVSLRNIQPASSLNTLPSQNDFCLNGGANQPFRTGYKRKTVSKQQRPSVSQKPTLQQGHQTSAQTAFMKKKTSGTSPEKHSEKSTQQNDSCLNSPTKEFSYTSKTQTDFLSVPSGGHVRRHKGSFEMDKLFEKGERNKISLRATVSTGESVQSLLGQKPETFEQKQRFSFKNLGVSKKILNGTLKFNEVIGLIHYCRLAYKYLSELKHKSVYQSGDLNLKYYSNYILNLLGELLEHLDSGKVSFVNSLEDPAAKSQKLTKMSKVVSDYIERYKSSLEKERAQYLNKETEQIRGIVESDNKFIKEFNIPQKQRLLHLNECLARFASVLEKCTLKQTFSEFDSNEELENCMCEPNQPETALFVDPTHIAHRKSNSFFICASPDLKEAKSL